MPSTTKILIRPERVTDYAEISSLHACAFGNRLGEPLIVALHRQRRAFDPELSLVAEIDGRLIGHVLFSPHHIRLLGSTVPAVNLAPIAVQPAYQGQGIGGQLITERGPESPVLLRRG
jgi:predicted N-acetyltransferase YhbS